jgi:hypothetical protein
VSAELPDDALDRRLNVGSLPSGVRLVDAGGGSQCVRRRLKEEIRTEGLVRSIESFSRFLDVAALTTGSF